MISTIIKGHFDVSMNTRRSLWDDARGIWYVSILLGKISDSTLVLFQEISKLADHTPRSNEAYLETHPIPEASARHRQTVPQLLDPTYNLN